MTSVDCIGKSTTAIKAIKKIDWLVFIAVFLSAVFIGLITHELMHALMIPELSTITINLGDTRHLVEVCCFESEEIVFELTAYLTQGFVMAAWVCGLRKKFVKQVN